MAELAEKGADINIVADFDGSKTFGDRARIVGRNGDGTVSNGQSITIYINMYAGGEPIGNVSFAFAVVHELIHTFGDHTLDADLDAPDSTLDRDITKDIFAGYDYYAAAVFNSAGTEVASVPSGGGALSGTAYYDVMAGSDYADTFIPSTGGSAIYSGNGDDRFLLTVDGMVDEIIDTQGNDTIELPSGTDLASVSLRWSAEGQNLFLLVNGRKEAAILDAASMGRVENLSVGGIDYALGSLASTVNAAPLAQTIYATVYDSFSGGWVASGATQDSDGDRLEYRLLEVRGDYAYESWEVDRLTGSIFSTTERPVERGSKATFLTLEVSDGFDSSQVEVVVRWANSDDPDTLPHENAFLSPDHDQPGEATMLLPNQPEAIGFDLGGFYA